MLTYNFSQDAKIPLYEQLYGFIRDDIISGRIRAGTKLPSKRALAENLEISRITVENAYYQLCAEGYLRSEPRRGYFAENVSGIAGHTLSEANEIPETPPPPEEVEFSADITGNRIEASLFPFSVWSRLMRETLLDYDSGLLDPLPRAGAYRLRRAISAHLRDFRGMKTAPEQIVIGAGAEYLYMMIAMLLGRDRLYATENPGYGKTGRIYSAMGAKCVYIGMDRDGVIPSELYRSGADVLHISPSHHFPTGIVTSAGRRGELLEWAAGGGFIIEDDYDSEFRFSPRPIPPMQAMDSAGRAIFVNTFSKTISPSLRIGYMVLPEELRRRCEELFGFFSCTVSAAEQYTLASFIEKGYFEKHINRMRRFYKGRRDRILKMIADSPLADRVSVSEEHAGLHFLMKVNTQLCDVEFKNICAKAGIRAAMLSEYYKGGASAAAHTVVVNYSGVNEAAFETALGRLAEMM